MEPVDDEGRIFEIRKDGGDDYLPLRSESRDMATFAISCLVLVMPYQLEVPEVEAQESKGAASVNQ